MDRVADDGDSDRCRHERRAPVGVWLHRPRKISIAKHRFHIDYRTTAYGKHNDATNEARIPGRPSERLVRATDYQLNPGRLTLCEPNRQKRQIPADFAIEPGEIVLTGIFRDELSASPEGLDYLTST